MPFIAQSPHPYTREHIATVPDQDYGVYGIFSSTQCLYVGMGYIKDRMLAHINGDNPKINAGRPVYWYGEKGYTEAQAAARESQLIAELLPTCNEQKVPQFTRR